MRAFVAIELPEEVKRALARFQEPWAQVAGLQRTRPEQCHLTLKFLGEIDERLRAEFAAALAAVRAPAFPLELTQLGAFPNARRPRVLWVGVTSPPELAELARAVDRATAAVRLDKPFRAHVTLGRIRGGRDGSEGLGLDRAVARCRFTANAFVLFQSVLAPEGARYTAVERFELVGPR